MAVPGMAQIDVLATARQRANEAYAGWTYGPGLDNRTRQIDCASLVVDACRTLATECGRKLTAQQVRAIALSNIAPDEDLQSLLTTGTDTRLRGVAQALVESGLGIPIASIREAAPGDFVQYWYRSGGRWKGHAAIIESVDSSGRATLFGSHERMLALRADGKDRTGSEAERIPVERGGIGTSRPVDLREPAGSLGDETTPVNASTKTPPPQIRVYIARWSTPRRTTEPAATPDRQK
jgi:hypothetical protein